MTVDVVEIRIAPSAGPAGSDPAVPWWAWAVVVNGKGVTGGGGLAFTRPNALRAAADVVRRVAESGQGLSR